MDEKNMSPFVCWGYWFTASLIWWKTTTMPHFCYCLRRKEMSQLTELRQLSPSVETWYRTKSNLSLWHWLQRLRKVNSKSLNTWTRLGSSKLVDLEQFETACPELSNAVTVDIELHAVPVNAKDVLDIIPRAADLIYGKPPKITQKEMTTRGMAWSWTASQVYCLLAHSWGRVEWSGCRIPDLK